MTYAALHCHCTYSYLDGVGHVKSWINGAKDKGLSGLAITDHGYSASFAELSYHSRKENFPIVFGCEMYITQTLERDTNDRYRHITVWVKNQIGLKNFFKLQYLAFSADHMYYRPRITYDELFAHKEGLAIGSACISGFLAEDIYHSIENKESATDNSKIWSNRLQEFMYHFKDDLYLEVQPHSVCTEWNHKNKTHDNTGKDRQEIINKAYKHSISKNFGIKMIVSPDAHMVDKEDKIVQDCLMGTKYSSSKISDDGDTALDAEKLGWHFHETYFLPKPDELKDMYLQNFSHIFDSNDIDLYMKNSMEVMEKCKEVHLNKKVYLPTHAFEGIKSGSEVLVGEILELGRLKGKGKVYLDRMKMELEVLTNNGHMDFTGYFLLLADVVKWAKANDVVVGMGRGSVGGCLVAYALGITGIDPIKYNLSFERFINPARIAKGTIPDIDIDFSDQAKIYNYLRDKYGDDKVCGITANQAYKFKLALKDAYRGLTGKRVGVGLESICKLVSEDMEDEEEVKKWLELDQVKDWIEHGEKGDNNLTFSSKAISSKDRLDVIKTASKMHGLARHPGVHAAAVVVSPIPIHEVVPVAKARGKMKDKWVTQYTMEWVEASGLVKFDLLGLNTLSDIGSCIKLIKSRHNVDIDIYNLPEDMEVFKHAFSDKKKLNINMTSVFQFDTDVAKAYLEQLFPQSISDLCMITAVARPGAMDSNQDQLFVQRWNDKSKIEYAHTSLEKVLSETLGIMIYQEQVMAAVQILGGFSAGEADDIRRGMGKKKPELLAAARSRFLEYSVQNYSDIDQKYAEKLWDDIDSFARYGFNKSHSIAYAYTAYICLYLKHYYPMEWWCAILMNETDSDRISRIVSATKSFLVSPSINYSKTEYTIIDNKIVIPMSFVYGVGLKATDNILKARESGDFLSLEDFCNRIDTKTITKNIVLQLIWAGCFDSMYPDLDKKDIAKKYFDWRVTKPKTSKADIKKLNEEYENTCANLNRLQQIVRSSQALPTMTLDYHPIISSSLNNITLRSYDDVFNAGDNSAIQTAGIITNIHYGKTKNGDDYASVDIQNSGQILRCTLWPKELKHFNKILNQHTLVKVNGRVNRWKTRLSLVVSSLECLA